MNEEALAPVGPQCHRERERERERETFCSTVYDTFCYEVKRADGLESMNLVLPTVTSTGS